MTKFLSFNGIKFCNITCKNLLVKINEEKSFVVAPSGPGLSTIDREINYFISLKSADIAILDSGLFCIFLNLFTQKKVKKLSGYKFLKYYLDYIKDTSTHLYCIDPDIRSSNMNKLFLKNVGIKSSHYIAPIYNKNFVDYKLLESINYAMPNVILINIAGGKQEILGNFINSNINKKIPILCFGAAISFLTGDQARINDFWDSIYMGWLYRILNNPRVFLPRYFKAFKFLYIFFKYYRTIK